MNETYGKIDLGKIFCPMLPKEIYDIVGSFKGLLSVLVRGLAGHFFKISSEERRVRKV